MKKPPPEREEGRIITLQLTGSLRVCCIITCRPVWVIGIGHKPRPVTLSLYHFHLAKEVSKRDDRPSRIGETEHEVLSG